MIRWVFLHHRCASRWMSGIIQEQARAHGLTTFETNYASRDPFIREIRDLVASYDLVISGNARPAELAQLDAAAPDEWGGIHLTRDPRDVWVSSYYSHLHSHPLETLPELVSHRETLQSRSLERGLLADLDFYMTRQAIESILAWPLHSAVWNFRYEVLFSSVGRTATSLRETLLHLRIPLEGLDYRLSSWSFEKLSGGRLQGQRDDHHHYRSGTSGHWRTVLTPLALAVFTHRYGHALEAAGYGEPNGSASVKDP